MATRLHLAPGDAILARRAALVHDTGLVAVPSYLLDNQGTWAATEFEKYRLHPYYTERILSRSPLLRDIGLVAGAHHEALDGSGYHRGAKGNDLSITARVVAVAARFQEKAEGAAAEKWPEVLEALKGDGRRTDCVTVLAQELALCRLAGQAPELARWIDRPRGGGPALACHRPEYQAHR